MKRWQRWLIIGLLLLALVGIGLEVGRRYWLSPHAAAQVAARLQATLGAPVEVADVNIGINSSSLHDLKLFEAGAPSAAPWATIAEVQADVSILDLLRGEATPSELTLSGVDVTLRFDPQGHLQTQIPHSGGGSTQTLPELHIEGGQLTVRQESHPDMVIAGINGGLRTEAGQQVLTGTVDDPHWGSWSLGGTMDSKSAAGSATVRTKQPIHVTQSMLQALPLISAGVWQEVQLEGDTPVDLTVNSDPHGRGVHYKVTLAPRATTVHVPSIDLSAAQAHGQVVINDGLIELRDVEGQAAGGEIKTSGDLDFRETPNRLDFHVAVDRLDMRLLPKKWSLPRQIEGHLSGEATLDLTIAGGRTRTSGSGEGVVRDARVGGQPAEPITLRLRGGADGYRFTAQGTRQRVNDGDRLALAIMPQVALQAPANAAGAELAALPGQVINESVTLVQEAVAALGDAGTVVMDRLSKPFAHQVSTPASGSRSLDINLTMKDVHLEQFIQGLGVHLPFPVSGRLSFHVQAAIPLDSSGDLKSYRFNGTATLPEFSLAGLELQQVQARVTYAHGILRLEELTGQVAPGSHEDRANARGTFQGSARMQLVPPGALSAQLALVDIPVVRVVSLVPGSGELAQGTFSGTFEATGQAAELQKIQAWVASGTLKTNRMQAYGLTLQDTTADVHLKDGLITVTDLQGRLEGTPVDGSAQVRLVDPFRYQAKLHLNQTDLAALQHLAPELRPSVHVEGRLECTANMQGTLHPLALTTSGTGEARNLKVEGFRIEQLQFHWATDRDRLALTDIHGSLYGGELTGKATVPLQRAVAGSVNLNLQGMDMGALAKNVPSMPVRLSGQAGGTLDGTLSAATTTQPRVFAGTLDLRAPRLQVQGIATERLHGTVEYQQEAIAYHLEGKSLGGTFNLDGRLPATKGKLASAPANEGHLHIEGVRLGRLWPALGAEEKLRPLRGVLSLDVAFQHGSDWKPIGSGHFELARFRWNQEELAERMEGDITVNQQEMRIRNLQGALGGGTLRAQLALSLTTTGRSWFDLATDQVDASRLLAPWPEISARVQGSIGAHFHGAIGRAWTGGGRLSLVHGRVFGVDINEWDVPVRFVWVPQRSYGQVEIHESFAQAAHGRLTLDATYMLGYEKRLQGQMHFTRLDLQTLLRQVSTTSQVGAGRVTGHVEFAGKELSSLNDLTATVNASFEQTQAMQFPVMQQLLPFVAPGQSSSTTFSQGALRARLAAGVLRIQQLSLAGRALELFIEGNVTLQGRLALAVQARTSTLAPNPVLLRRLGLRLPLAGPLPLGFLVQAGNLLSNSLVNVRVSGTWREPIIQVEPSLTLTEGALRFFLGQANIPVP